MTEPNHSFLEVFLHTDYVPREDRHEQSTINGTPDLLAEPVAMNQSWSIHLMHDALVCDIRFRTFNVVDVLTGKR